MSASIWLAWSRDGTLLAIDLWPKRTVVEDYDRVGDGLYDGPGWGIALWLFWSRIGWRG